MAVRHDRSDNPDTSAMIGAMHPLRLAGDVVHVARRAYDAVVGAIATAEPQAEAGKLVAPPSAAARFRWEADMLAPVASSVHTLAPWLKPPGALVAEVPAAIGVVDLLGIHFDPRALGLRVEADVRPVVLPLRVRVLHALLAGPLLIEDLARDVGSHRQALTRSTLRPLQAADLIELEGDVVRSTGLWLPVARRTVAVELKLSKWRDALNQADNFARSADESWVVLDAACATSAIAAQDEFAERGVGLAVVEPTGRVDALLPAVRNRPEGWLRALIAERALAAMDEFEPVFVESAAQRRDRERPRMPSEPRTVAVV